MTRSEFARPTPSDALVVSVSSGPSGTVISLCGEADLFTLPLVVDALDAAIADRSGPIVVDLADTDFIDTGNVRALAGASQHLNDFGRTLTIRSPSRGAARVLALLGVASLIEREAASA